MVNLIGLKMSLALVLGLGIAKGPIPANEAGCTTVKAQTTCNWYLFKKTLGAARVVKAQYSGIDRSTGSQLQGLVKELGKRVAKDDETADLTFIVTPAAISGVDIGPADEEILELKIYEGGSISGKLIWVERYRGQKDKPWPAEVHAAIEQFHSRLTSPNSNAAASFSKP